MAVKKRKEDVSINKVYKMILLGVTAVFVVALLLVIIKPFGYRSLNSLKEIKAEEIVIQETSNQYFVFIYEPGSDEAKMVEDKIVEYARYAKNNKDAKPIFVVEKTDENTKTIYSYLSASFDKENGFPCLLTISSGSVAQTKSTVSTILTQLDEEMSKK